MSGRLFSAHTAASRGGRSRMGAPTENATHQNYSERNGHRDTGGDHSPISAPNSPMHPLTQSQGSMNSLLESDGVTVSRRGSITSIDTDTAAAEILSLCDAYRAGSMKMEDFLTSVRLVANRATITRQVKTVGSKPVPVPPPRQKIDSSRPRTRVTQVSTEVPRRPSNQGRGHTAIRKNVWTEEEEEALVLGVKTFGEGQYNKILLADSKSKRLLISKPLPELSKKWKELKPIVESDPTASPHEHVAALHPQIGKSARMRRVEPEEPGRTETLLEETYYHEEAIDSEDEESEGDQQGPPPFLSQRKPLPPAREKPQTRRTNAPSITAIQEDQEMGLYEDPDFKCINANLFEDDPSRIAKGLKWLRPEEYTDSPRLFVGGVEAGDVMQGDLGDCWFLSALSCVGNDPTIIPKLFTTDQAQPGRYDLRFFKNGAWRPVTIDDRIPCVPDGKGGYKPAYGRGHDINEVWVPLIEKAYAKLHGCYEHLEGGRISQALGDMTGGACEKMYFTEAAVIEQFETGHLWDRFQEFFERGDLIGCGYGDSEAAVEGEREDGVLLNHAYGVIACKEVHGFKLLRCRNPWGRAGEWKGAWSDKSPMWSKYPDVAKACEFVDQDDGMFWISFEDFFKSYNEAYICHMFPEDVYRHIGYGDMFWEDTDGGVPIMSKKYSVNWRSNPQYLIHVSPEAPSTIFLQMSQPDSRIDYGDINYHRSIGFLIVKGEPVDGIPWRDYPRFLKFVTPEVRVHHCKAMDHGFVSDEIVLPPNGDVPYYVIPYSFQNDGVKRKFKEGTFLFEIFSADTSLEFSEVREDLDCYIYEIEGELTRANSQGYWKYPTWDKNPQFGFKTTCPKTEVSIVMNAAQEMQHLGLTFFRDPDGKGHLPKYEEKLLQGSGEFVPFEVMLHRVAQLPEYNYVIGCCTYKPGIVGKFKVLVYSSSELVFQKGVKVRLQSAGRKTHRLPSEERKFALPMGYDESAENIRSQRAMSRLHIKRDSQGHVYL